MIDLRGPKYDPLTPAEVAELWPIAKQGDEKARERLICSTLRSVVSECYRYATKFDIDDLIGMAFVVATECFDSYDPKKGMQFYSYVVVSVRWKIGEELQKNHVKEYCTDDEGMLEAFGGCTPTDPDTEHHREKRNAIIMNYLLSIPTITPEMIDYALKCKEGTQKAPNGLFTKLYAAARRTKPTPQILQAITELMGADTAAKAVQTYEHATLQDKLLAERKERGRIIRERKAEREAQRITPEQKERQRLNALKNYYNRNSETERITLAEQRKAEREAERITLIEQRENLLREIEELKREREAERIALAEQRKNDRIEAQKHREWMKAHTKELKALEREKKRLQRTMKRKETTKANILQRMIDPHRAQRQIAVSNFNKLYEYIFAHTDAEPMQAEAAAYLTLKDYTTLREWSDRHSLPYITVKRWRMYVKKKLAALPHVDEDIRSLDPTLFKS